MRATPGARRKLDWLEFDAADLDGGIVLPVTVADLVLVRRLEFENHDFRMPPLLDDFSHDFRFRGVRSGQKLLFVGAHGQHFAKGDLPAHFAGQSFHLHGVSWRHTVLFASTTNDGVHRPSRCKSETTIIGGIPKSVNERFNWMATQFEKWPPLPAETHGTQRPLHKTS